MKALGAGKRICALRKIPSWHSWLHVPGTKGGSGRKGPVHPIRGFPSQGLWKLWSSFGPKKELPGNRSQGLQLLPGSGKYKPGDLRKQIWQSIFNGGGGGLNFSPEPNF